MFNFRENNAVQLAGRNSAAILMRLALTPCTTWIHIPGIFVCKYKEAAP